MAAGGSYLMNENPEQALEDWASREIPVDPDIDRWENGMTRNEQSAAFRRLLVRNMPLALASGGVMACDLTTVGAAMAVGALVLTGFQWFEWPRAKDGRRLLTKKQWQRWRGE